MTKEGILKLNAWSVDITKTEGQEKKKINEWLIPVWD